MKKLFARVVAVAAIGLAASSFAATIDLASVTKATMAANGDVLTGTLGGDYKISIAAGAYVMLRNVTISGSNSASCPWAGLTCLGDAEIRIDGTNTVKGFYEECPGIYVPEGKTLTIRQAVSNVDYTNPLYGGTLPAQGHNYAAASARATTSPAATSSSRAESSPPRGGMPPASAAPRASLAGILATSPSKAASSMPRAAKILPA